jgi:hypothetical protein
MKNLKVIFLAVPFLLFSCNTDHFEEDALSTEMVSGEIYQQDGILHFPSAEKCMETIHALTAVDADLSSFEDQYHFTSLTSVVDEALDVLSEIEDPDAYASALDTYEDLLTVTEGGLVVPRIIARGYSHIANPEGVFYVNDIKYTVTPEKVIYESTGTRSSIKGEFVDYISEISYTDDDVPEINETRAETVTDTKYYDLNYATSDRKVFFRAHVIRHSFVDAGPNPGTHYYDVQFHMSGQKKSLFGWNSYNTIFSIAHLRCSLFSPGFSNVGIRVISSYSVNTELIESTECKNYYLTIPNALVATYSGAPQLIGFNVLKLRATSRGTGGCGVAVNVYPFSIMEVPVTPCP